MEYFSANSATAVAIGLSLTVFLCAVFYIIEDAQRLARKDKRKAKRRRKQESYNPHPEVPIIKEAK